MQRTPIEIPSVFGDFSHPYRYRIWYGGRGSGKSWTIARVLLAMAATRSLRILCCREYQNSMGDSVQRLLEDQIDTLALTPWFTITRNAIRSTTGSEFIFRGLGRHVQSIKSIEKIDIAWIEEAQSISQNSLDILLPTIRAPHSEIWFTYNPNLAEDPVHRLMLSLQKSNRALVRKVGWQDNPWFPAVLHEERLRLQTIDPHAYAHVWEGECRIIHEAVIFRDRFCIEPFDSPPHARLYFGVDWGFACDPTMIIRCFVQDNILHIDDEAGGAGIELDELPALFDQLADVRKWPIRADSSRPETISYLRRRHGFRLVPARKGAGSIQDGIERIRSFSRIRIHPRCEHTAREFSLYSYKVDRISGDILPQIADTNNHCIDALRYALEPLIQPRPHLPDFSHYRSNA